MYILKVDCMYCGLVDLHLTVDDVRCDGVAVADDLLGDAASLVHEGLPGLEGVGHQLVQVGLTSN